MAIPHAQPGDLIDVRPLNGAWEAHRTTTLIKTDQVDVVRMLLPAGKKIAEHRATGQILIQGVEGKVVFHTLGRTIEIEAGTMFYLPAAEPHSVEAITNSTFLLTLLLPHSG
jgi:quercetin dioxygenase-like cupin family protein